MNNQVIIIIEDNGKGMPESVKEKILNNMVVTSGKDHGNGIGFTQIRDILQEHAGALSIDSIINVGTKIQLTFEQTTSPAWAVDRIELNENDLVVVVDDDPSIHGAWDTRFHSDVPNTRLKHFEQGKEAIEFINQLTPEEKQSIFLLTDYELLGQSVNGLDIVEKTQLTRTVLVTSHSDNEAIRERALSLKTRILPKLLASNIFIKLKETQLNEQVVSDVEVVIIDDDAMIRDTVAMIAFSNKKVAKYAEPEVFLDNISNNSLYAKNTFFLIDHNFEGSSINGLIIAKKLYEHGYSHLYLFSGESIMNHEIPHYLTVIQKMDTEKLMELGRLNSMETIPMHIMDNS
jgi:FixJ family two-component response regulator